MWRSFFLALGTYSCLLGGQCLAIDKAIMTSREETPSSPMAFMRSAFDGSSDREVVPPDWAPWTLMSAGAVTLLYSFTIPNRVKE